MSFRAITAKEEQINIDQFIVKAVAEANLVVDFALKKLRHEPPQPAGTRYIRTHKLKRGWKKETIHLGGGIVVRAINRVRYVRFVQGDPDKKGGQQPIHEGRWVSAPELSRALHAEYRPALARLRRKYGGVVGG